MVKKQAEGGAAPRRGWRARGWRLLRELALLAIAFVVLSTVVGRLRAPDLPEEAPRLVLPDLQGRLVDLQELRGQMVVLNFWATWCAPCRVEIPSFSSFARAHPDVVVLGVAVDGERRELQQAADELGIDYPVLVGDADTVQRYGATTVPTTVVVGPDGRVKAAHVGVMLGPQLWLATR